ncbi:MAG TPA: polysaccharide deacetylase family protein [Candidatus Saccharimonadia bacterium]|nr:polysaccharide deacetylase family protein [Candidatus Saccharimonadia bacterium]
MSERTAGGIAVLMYHAIAPGSAGAAAADPRYTITRAQLAEQLRALRTRVGAARAVRDVLRDSASTPTNSPRDSESDSSAPCITDALAAPALSRAPTIGAGSPDRGLSRHGADACGVALTFDDGHETNFTEALPLLVEHGANADFFVNPAKVGTWGHASWAQLREMADAGMSIQSHGYDHTYFTALTPSALERDLRSSKAEIEHRVGREVTLLAPPGGRMPPLLAILAGALGYTAVVSSRPALWSSRADALIPRLAVTSDTDVERIVGWASGDARAMRGAVWRYALLARAKRVFGDDRYERIRARVLAARPALPTPPQDRPA